MVWKVRYRLIGLTTEKAKIRDKKYSERLCRQVERMDKENKSFDDVMSKSKNELEALRAELNSLMVKFGLRTLRTYQTGKRCPLRYMEIKSLVKYELENVIADLSHPDSIESIIERTALELEKQQQK